MGGLGREDRLDDRDIAGATANVAREDLADAVRIGGPLVAQKRMCRRQQAGGAEAALQRLMLAKGLLQPSEGFLLGPAFYRHDPHRLVPPRKGQTSPPRLS